MEAPAPMARPAILASSPSLNSFPELPASTLAASAIPVAGTPALGGRTNGAPARFAPGSVIGAAELSTAAGGAELAAAAGALAQLGGTERAPIEAAWLMLAAAGAPPNPPTGARCPNPGAGTTPNAPKPSI